MDIESPWNAPKVAAAAARSAVKDNQSVNIVESGHDTISTQPVYEPPQHGRKSRARDREST